MPRGKASSGTPRQLKELQFPLGGLNRSVAFQSQPPYSSPDCLNVRPLDQYRRARGALRPGARQQYFNGFSTSPINMIADVSYIDVTTAAGSASAFWYDDFSIASNDWYAYGTLPTLGKNMVYATNGQTRGARLSLGNITTSPGKEAIGIFIQPYLGQHYGEYYIYLRMNNSAPSATTDGIVVKLVLTGTGANAGAYTLTVTQYVASTPTVLGTYTGGGSTLAAGAWLNASVVGTTVSVGWGAQGGGTLYSGTVTWGGNEGYKYAYGLKGTVAGGQVQVAGFRFVYQDATKIRALQKQLLVAAGGALYRNESYGYTLAAATAGTTTLASDRPLRFGELNQKLYIADNSEPLCAGTGKAIAEVPLGTPWTVAVTLGIVTVDTITAHNLTLGSRVTFNALWTASSFLASISATVASIPTSHTFTFSLTSGLSIINLGGAWTVTPSGSAVTVDTIQSHGLVTGQVVNPQGAWAANPWMQSVGPVVIASTPTLHTFTFASAQASHALVIETGVTAQLTVMQPTQTATNETNSGASISFAAPVGGTLTNASANWQVGVGNNVVIVDTIAAHGLALGDLVWPQGAWSVNTFMSGLAPFVVASVPTLHTFTFAQVQANQIPTTETNATAALVYSHAAGAATVGTLANNSGKTITDSAVNFTTLGVSTYDHIVRLVDSTGIVKTFNITTVTDHALTLTIGPYGLPADGNYSYSVLRGVKVYDPALATPTLSLLVPTKGNIEPSCPLMCVYANRLVIGGCPQAPQAYFASRINDPTDWEYLSTAGGSASASDGARAWAATDTDTGSLGKPLTALVPWGSNYLLVSAEKELWVLEGDLTYGGTLRAISREVGILGAQAYCWTPDGYLCCLTSQGVYGLTPYWTWSAGSPMGESMFQFLGKSIPNELKNLPIDLIYPVLVWDDDAQGVHVLVTWKDGSKVGMHYFLDWASKSWWPEQFWSGSLDPWCAHRHVSTESSQSGMLFAGRQSIITKFDRRNDNDIGSAITNYVDIGPVRTSNNPRNDGIVSEINAMMGASSGAVAWALRAGPDAELAYAAATAATGTWPAGQSYKDYPRVRGQAALVRLSGTCYWDMESMRMVVIEAGAQRKL